MAWPQGSFWTQLGSHQGRAQGVELVSEVDSWGPKEGFTNLDWPPKTSLHLLPLGFLGTDRHRQIHTQWMVEPAF